jgi:hypothetical protein
MSYKVNYNTLITYAQTSLQGDTTVTGLVDSDRILTQDYLLGGKLPAILIQSVSKRSENPVGVGNVPTEVTLALPIKIVCFSKDTAGQNRDPGEIQTEAYNIADEVERVIREEALDWDSDGDYKDVVPARLLPDYEILSEEKGIFYFTLTIEVEFTKRLASS